MLKLLVTAATDYSINSLKFDVTLVDKELEVSMPVFFDIKKEEVESDYLNKCRDQAITHAIVTADLQEHKGFTRFTQNTLQVTSAKEVEAPAAPAEAPKTKAKTKAKEEPKPEVKEEAAEEDMFGEEEAPKENVENFDKTNAQHKQLLIESIAKVAGNDWPKSEANKPKSKALGAELATGATPFLRDNKLSKEAAALIKKHFK